MVSNSIWMDSGAMVSMIPEMDLYLGDFVSIAGASENKRVITLNGTFTTNFSLVANLYRGCYLNIYVGTAHTGSSSGDSLTENQFIDRVMIISNDATTITVNDSLDADITGTANKFYGVIEHQGAPIPAPKGASAGNVYVAQVLNIRFASDTRADYDNDSISFGQVPSSAGSSSTAYVIGITNDGSYGGTSANLEVNINDSDLTTAEEIIDVIVAEIGKTGSIHFSASRSGDSLVLTNTYGGLVSQTAAVNDTSNLVLSTTTAGATTASTNPRLLSDTWLGLTSTVTIPSTSIDVKNIPISTASRSMVYQFKGAETTSGGSFSLSANNFGWLYYALGNKTATLASGGTPTITNEFATSGLSDTAFIIDTDVNSAGFHRVEDNKICPPLNPQLGQNTGNVQSVSDTLTNKITYTFTESESEDLPTFALEYTLKKPDDLSTVAVDSNKETVYSKIYPGCMVNSLTMEASANQEVTMNVNFETKKTFVAPTNYDTANNVTDAKNFVNFGSPRGGDSNSSENFMRPFFFSDGTISMFGQDYIRIESFSLSIENSLQPKRFIGSYDKTSQFHFPAQRSYRLNFTGLVTDSAVFDALRRTEAYSLSGTTGNELTLLFRKETGATDETLTLKFEDYMVVTADFPLTNDKGPITVSWEIVPLNLKECQHVTNWILQG